MTGQRIARSRAAVAPRLQRRDYQTLSEFRYLLQRFLAFSQAAAHEAGSGAAPAPGAAGDQGVPTRRRCDDPRPGRAAVHPAPQRRGAGGPSGRGRPGGAPPRSGRPAAGAAGPDAGGREAAGRLVGNPPGGVTAAASGVAGDTWRRSGSSARACPPCQAPLRRRSAPFSSCQAQAGHPRLPCLARGEVVGGRAKPVPRHEGAAGVFRRSQSMRLLRQRRPPRHRGDSEHRRAKSPPHQAGR